MFTSPKKNPCGAIGANHRQPNPLRYVNLDECDDDIYGGSISQESEPDAFDEPWPYRFQVPLRFNLKPWFCY